MSNDDWIDADIKALDLSYGEKAGLQVYRNYTLSFEKHTIKQFREALNNDNLDLYDLAKIVRLIANEDVRLVPLLLCAFADERLELALKRTIPDGVPGGKAGLFNAYGPLSDLSKRIKMAYAFDIASPDLMAAMDLIRIARNKISHSWDTSALNELFETGRLATLFPVETLLSDGARGEPAFSKTLGPNASFRVRAAWIAGRLNYETAFYGLAKKARLSPARVLYEDGGTQWLNKIAAICMDATRSIVSAEK